MALVLYLAGLSRSLEFTSINAIAYAEVTGDKMSSATSFTSVLQQLSGSIGITIAAMSLEMLGWARGIEPTALPNYLPPSACWHPWPWSRPSSSRACRKRPGADWSGRRTGRDRPGRGARRRICPVLAG